MYTLITCRVVKIYVRDDSPTVICQYPLSHLGIDMFLLINGVFIKHFPTICWMISLTVILVATPIRIRYAAIGLIRSGFRRLLAPLIMTCGENKSAVNFCVVGVNETTPPPEVLFNFFDFAVIFLATDGSTRRMARDGRPSRPARPAR